MHNFYSIFYRHVETDEYSQEAYKYEVPIGKDAIKLDELLFLYRQARIYNIESELGLSSDVKRREGVLKFFEKMVLRRNDSPLFAMFRYEKENDSFDLSGFIGSYISFIVLKKEDLLWLFIDEALRLFDFKSIQVFCLIYVDKLRESNKRVPAFIASVVGNLNGLDADDTIAYAKANKIDDDEEELNRALTLIVRFINAIYIDSCLTPKSKSFLVLADDLYSKLKKSTFADFSVVSLQYYKIIETELKEKIIKEAMKGIKFGRLYVGNYKYYKVSDFDCSSMSLGEISTIFDDAIEFGINGESVFKQEKYSINEEFYQNIYKICLNNVDFLYYFRDITCTTLRQMFRNPPAHTEPLPDYYIPLVEKLFISFIANLRNLKIKDNNVEKDDWVRSLIAKIEEE